MASEHDPWRLNNAALLNQVRTSSSFQIRSPMSSEQIATLAWANEGGDGAAMQQFYSSGRILYEIYSRFKQVGEQEKAIRRARENNQFSQFAL